HRKTSGEPQEEAQLHRRFRGLRGTSVWGDTWLVEESLQGVARLVLKNQCDAALMLAEGDRTQRPCGIEFGPHRHVEFQHPDAIGGRTLRRWHRHKNRGRMSCRARRSDPSPQDELSVLMKDRHGVTR